MQIFYFILLILGSISCIRMETCPTYEEIFPCLCKEEDGGDIFVACSENLLTIERLKYALNSLSGKENVNLRLRDLNLGTLPSNYFYGIGITRLEIINCKLNSLSDDGRPGLLGLEMSLQKFSIISSFKEDNGPVNLKFDHLVAIKDIEISDYAITELDDEWFGRGPIILEYLKISNNRIEKIGRNAFKHLISLKELRLTGNRFGPIQRSMLPYSARYLEYLELDDNALTGLPDDIFSHMPALSTISLRNNGISRLEQRVWYLIWGQLDVVNLEGNPIYCNSHMNWVFEIRRTSAVYGRCYFPKEFEGQDLEDFIESRSRFKKQKSKFNEHLINGF